MNFDLYLHFLMQMKKDINHKFIAFIQKGTP